MIGTLRFPDLSSDRTGNYRIVHRLPDEFVVQREVSREGKDIGIIFSNKQPDQTWWVFVDKANTLAKAKKIMKKLLKDEGHVPYVVVQTNTVRK